MTDRPTSTAGWTVAELRAGYLEGRLDPAVVVQRCLEALAELDDPAVLIGGPLTREAAADLARLDTLDAAEHPLWGIPFVVKDNLDVAGIATTAACPAFATATGPAMVDATAVARLRAGGAVLVGKANLDQFATGLVGVRSPFGTPRNPFAADRVPGGSSSGSAVVVARGLVPFALGSDTAGSGRVPAAFGNVVGLKPTFGMVPTTGLVPAMRRADCISVFALTVADAASVLAVMAGVDASDPFSTALPDPPALPAAPVVGVLDEIGRDHLDEAWAAAYQGGLDAVAATGAELVRVDTGWLLEVGSLLYGSALVAERTAAVGHQVAANRDGIHPVVASIIERGERFGAVDAYRVEYRLAAARRRIASLWRDIDVLALPTVPGQPTLTEVTADPLGANSRLGTFTTFVNLLGAAAVVVPVIDPSTGALPDGLQLVAPGGHDAWLVALAGAVERVVGVPLGATGRPRPHQPIAPPTPPAATGTDGAPTSVELAVVGAHRVGQPLNHQLTDRSATLLETTTTSGDYRLYALAGTTPAKPGLVRVEGEERGAPIEVELWSLPVDGFGAFVAAIPPPLCIGTVELADGRQVKGFLCEARGLAGAEDITALGSWLAHVERPGAAPTRPPR